jgi:predicted nucleotidyltransferase
MGIAQEFVGGRDHLTRLNAGHFLAPTLVALFSAEAELARKARQAIASSLAGKKDPPLGLYQFGSSARAEETLDSDFDVLVIARDAKHRDLLLDRVLSAAREIRAQYGVSVAPIAYTIREAKRGRRASLAPWPELARDVVTISGPPLGELLR